MTIPRILIAVPFVLALAACTPAAETETATTTNPAISRIEGLTDCAALQAEFDTADTNGVTEYMEAADSRMRELGCY